MSVARQPPGPTFGECSWTRTSSDEVVVAMRGEIDALAIPELSRCLDWATAVNGSAHLVLDMTEVEFIDSVGLTAIVRAHKRVAAEGGSVRIRRPSPPVRKVLDIVGLAAVVPVEG